MRGMRRAFHVVLVVAIVVATAGCALPFGDDGSPSDGNGSSDEPEGSPTEQDPASRDGQTPGDGNGSSDEPEGSPTEQDPASRDGQTPGDGTGPDESTPDSTPDRGDDLLFDPLAYADLGTDGLPTDENRTYDRLVQLLDVDATPPAIEVTGLDERLAATFGEEFAQDPRFVRLNLTEYSGGDGPHATTSRGTIAVDPDNGSGTEIETVLAHEFVHHVQFREGWFTGPGPRGWNGDAPPVGTTERHLTYRSLIEGGAVYAADVYAQRHIAAIDRGRFQLDSEWDQYERGPPGDTYVSAPYALGGTYVHDQLQDPTELGRLYSEEPPTSTYEIIYPSADATVSHHEPDLTVNISNTEWRAKEDDRMGALFLHALLSSTHATTTADDVVRGFRGDHLVELYGPEDQRPFVWALNFASGDAADQFVTVFGEALDRRTDPYAGAFAIERLDDGTVMVLSGTERLRETAQIDGTGPEITVTFEGG